MAKVIMVQGTMSNVGKSILVAGLCRIFNQDGLRVAPFKSQNMSSNAHVLENGLLMSRAQAIQAEACEIEPSCHMNPILLKPVTDMGSEVIVNGESRGFFQAREYFAMKKTLVPEIMRAYDKLCEENDVIVVEGAGSPAEINLKQDDVVNMGLARLLRAPVLLAGDVNMGGVFAQLTGTLSLLEKRERDMVKALIINKFRGDKELLLPGLKTLEEKTGKPVAGVMPYLDLEIEAEDSLAVSIAGRTDPREYDKLAASMRENLDMKLIYDIMESGLWERVKPADIERRSFEIIESELTVPIEDELKPIIKRVIHTTADFSFAETLKASGNAVSDAIEALKKGARIFTDTNMAKTGINKTGLSRFSAEAFCFIADKDVAEAAEKHGTTRAVAAMDKAAEISGDAPVIFAIGNAPTALGRLCELYAQGKIKPALVIGAPVGFVNVVASKEMLVDSGLPYIVAEGRKGGSAIAAAIINALMIMAQS